MGMIDWNGDVKVWNTDAEMFVVVKVRGEWNCGSCKATIHNKSFCFGRGYQKFCIKCGFKVIDTFTASMENFIKELKEHKAKHKKKESEYLQNNMVESL